MALRIAVIGVSGKGNQNLSELPNASSDALRMLDALHQYRQPSTDLFAALEPEHTSERVLREGLTRFFSETKPADNVIFIYEGHGIEAQGKAHLLAADYPGYGTAGALSVEELTDWMGSGIPVNRILLLDACHSGQGRSNRRGLGRDVFFPEAGVSVLSACDLNEVAVDLDELGGGLFSFMASRALRGAAGTMQEGYRTVTVTGLFQFVAREVPAWLESNRRRLHLPDEVRMTPRCVTDLRGDPILTAVPLVTRVRGDRVTLSQQRTAGNDDSGLGVHLDTLQALARTAAVRALGVWGSKNLFLDPDQHRRELELLLGRCSADLQTALTPVEVFVLRAAVCTHDLGLLETRYPEKRFQRAADFVRARKAHDLPVLLPNGILTEAVAQALEGLGGLSHDGELLWEGVPVRTNLLARMLGLAHRLAVVGERLAEDVGCGEVGRAWVRRACLSGIGDWDAGGAALILPAPGLTDTEWEAVRRWRATADSSLSLCRAVGDDIIGPLWIDLRK